MDGELRLQTNSDGQAPKKMPPWSLILPLPHGGRLPEAEVQRLYPPSLREEACGPNAPMNCFMSVSFLKRSRPYTSANRAPSLGVLALALAWELGWRRPPQQCGTAHDEEHAQTSARARTNNRESSPDEQ